MVTPEALSRVYEGLGNADSPSLSCEEAWSAVLERGGTLDLQDGLQVRRSMIMGVSRVELTGFSEGAIGQLKALGLTSEIIAWRLRLFLPLINGQPILAALLERHPLLRANAAA
jgi:hypothetical protein